jgi:hypothetical protein
VGFTHLAFGRAVIAHPWPKRERQGCVAVAAALASHAHAGTGDNCWPSTNTLAREAGVSRPTVIRARRALRDAGFLRWERAPGRAHCFRYRLAVPTQPGPGGKTDAPRQAVHSQDDAPRDDGRGKTENTARSNERTASRSHGGTVTGRREPEQGTGGERAHAREDSPPPLRRLLEDEDLPEGTWIELLAQYATECAIPGAKSKDFVTQAGETLRCGVERLGLVEAIEAERDSGAPRVYYRVFDELKDRVKNETQLDHDVVTPERLNGQLRRPLSNISLSPDQLDELAADIKSRGLKMRDVSSAVSDAVSRAPSARGTDHLALLIETLGLPPRRLAHVCERKG